MHQSTPVDTQVVSLQGFLGALTGVRRLIGLAVGHPIDC